MFEKEFEKLGGAAPLRGDNFEPLSKMELEEIKDSVSGRLPADYQKFLRQYGEIMFNESVGFKPVSEEAIYQHDEDSGYPNPTFKGSQVSVFFGNGADYSSSLAAKLEVYADRMPESVIPIADDGLGNKICIGVGPKNNGKVYWWDHHNEWDEDDYEDETGEEMPDEVKFQNLYLLADSFTEFVNKLYIVPGSAERK